MSLTSLQLLMNNQMQFVCLWCCVPPDFVVQTNNFSSLALLSPVIHRRKGKKLISKTLKYKLGSSSLMQFAFFYPKSIKNVSWENYRLSFFDTIRFFYNCCFTMATAYLTSSQLNYFDSVILRRIQQLKRWKKEAHLDKIYKEVIKTSDFRSV